MRLESERIEAPKASRKLRLPGAALAGCLVVGLTFLWAVSAMAQTTPTRLRGTITAIDGQTVTIATRDGTSVNVKLADDWVVALVAFCLVLRWLGFRSLAGT